MSRPQLIDSAYNFKRVSAPELAQMVDAGIPVKIIAAALHVSHQNIYERLSRYRLRKPSIDPTELRQLFVGGRLPVSIIAQHYNVSSQHIHYNCKKFGIKRLPLSIGRPQQRLAQKSRDILRRALQSPLAGRFLPDFGVSVGGLRRHIERMFSRQMNWENRGIIWHVDHIRPLCSFDLLDRAQWLDACHFSNLRPLEKHKNFAKNKKREMLL